MTSSAKSGTDEVLSLLLGELRADNRKGSGNLGCSHAGTGGTSDGVSGGGGNTSSEESSSKGLHDDSSTRKYYFSVY